jgi:phosphoribosyl-ATP pyrophosphohydrolase/phosphoribosyl-AMP cyclohydrolase
MLDLDALDFEKGGGAVTVVAQDAAGGAVLMVAHADREALERTLESGEMHFRSRTRGPWHKGATSGNVLRVVALAADCDRDAVLARVIPAGPACHTGAASCFGDAADLADPLDRLDRVIAARATREPAGPPAVAGEAGAIAPGGRSAAGTTARSSYTRRLLDDRNLRLKKLGEEATELAMACADGDPARAAEEAADLFYHALVALHGAGATLENVKAILAARAAAAPEAPDPGPPGDENP